MTHSMTMYDIESVSTASVQAKVEWKVDRTSLGATLRCLSSILASRTSRSMNYAIFHRRCIRATSFFPCRFPGKKLIFLPLHAYSHNSVKRAERSGEGIDINFNGSVFYARRDSKRVILEAEPHGFRKNRAS